MGMGPRAGILAALVTLVLGAVVSAGFGGLADERLWTSGDEPARVPEPTPTASPGAGRDAPGPSPSSPSDPNGSLPVVPVTVLVVLALALVVATVAVAVVAGLRVVRRRSDLTGHGRGASASSLPDAPDPEEEPEAALARGLATALAELGEGRPRNAIVALWLHLERVVRAADFPLRPSDTPTEFGERVAAAYRLDRGAMRRLADLYREARFSSHPLTTAQQDDARRSLRRLLADLQQDAR